jgi:hypothetical protein
MKKHINQMKLVDIISIILVTGIGINNNIFFIVEILEITFSNYKLKNKIK